MIELVYTIHSPFFDFQHHHDFKSDIPFLKKTYYKDVFLYPHINQFDINYFLYKYEKDFEYLDDYEFLSYKIINDGIDSYDIKKTYDLFNSFLKASNLAYITEGIEIYDLKENHSLWRENFYLFYLDSDYYSNFSSITRNETKFSKFQKSAFYGHLMGDGSILDYLSEEKMTPRFEYQQSTNCHTSYFNVVKNIYLSVLCIVKTYENKDVQFDNGTFRQYARLTIKNSFVSAQNKKWYKQEGQIRSKIIPKLEQELDLNLISIIFLICDDGNVASNGCVIALKNFKKSELEYFKEFLTNKFQIFSTLELRDISKEQWTIYITVSGMNIIRSFGKNLIPSSMEYKFYCKIKRTDCEALNSKTDKETLYNREVSKYPIVDKINGRMGCNECGSFVIDLLRHMIQVHLHCFLCIKCGVYFCSNDSLEKHQQEQSNCNLYKKWFCNKCGSNFGRKEDLSIHLSNIH